jgi:hypothetical protein
MVMTLRRVALLACAVLTPAAGQAAPQDAGSALVVESAPETVTLRFDAQGQSLAEVLHAFGGLLQQPIDFLAQEVAPERVRVDGMQVIARDRLRDALDSLLDRHGFWCWDDVSAGSTQLVVRKRHAFGSRGSGFTPPFTPRVIGLEELESGPEPRAPLYVVVFQLQHLAGRNLMTAISSSFDGSSESVRVTDGNAPHRAGFARPAAVAARRPEGDGSPGARCARGGSRRVARAAARLAGAAPRSDRSAPRRAGGCARPVSGAGWPRRLTTSSPHPA